MLRTDPWKKSSETNKLWSTQQPWSATKPQGQSTCSKFRTLIQASLKTTKADSDFPWPRVIFVKCAFPLFNNKWSGLVGKYFKNFELNFSCWSYNKFNHMKHFVFHGIDSTFYKVAILQELDWYMNCVYLLWAAEKCLSKIHCFCIVY